VKVMGVAKGRHNRRGILQGHKYLLMNGHRRPFIRRYLSPLAVCFGVTATLGPPTGSEATLGRNGEHLIRAEPGRYRPHGPAMAP